MRTLLLIVFLSVFWAPLRAQFIVAGQHATTDYYVDIPDTLVAMTCQNCPGSLLIDINGDATNDFEIYTSAFTSPGSQNRQVIVKPKNGNKVAGIIDSCGMPMATSFSFSDTINVSANWLASNVYLSFTDWSYGNPPQHCEDQTFFVPASFLGVQLISLTDTVYGWVGIGYIYSTSSTSCKIYEYACNSVNAGVSVINSDATLHIYPNPASSLLTVEVNSNKHVGMIQLQILNSLGQKVYETQVIANQRNRIELSSIRKGVYTVQLSDGQTSVHKKFVKE